MSRFRIAKTRFDAANGRVLSFVGGINLSVVFLNESGKLFGVLEGEVAAAAFALFKKKTSPLTAQPLLTPKLQRTSVVELRASFTIRSDTLLSDTSCPWKGSPFCVVR